METIVQDRNIKVYNYTSEHKKLSIFFKEYLNDGLIDIEITDFYTIDFSTHCKIGDTIGHDKDGIEISSIKIDYYPETKNIIFYDKNEIPMIIISCPDKDIINFKYLHTDIIIDKVF